MKVTIDKNHLLVIENPNIPQTKEYTYNVSGYTFSDFDTGIIVLHKKEWKIISLKNLGDTMSVCYVAPRTEIQTSLNTEWFVKWLWLFEGFDESTGKKYYFIPKFAEKDIGPINEILEKIGIQTQIEKTEKGCLIKSDIQPKEHRWKYSSFLFALALLYGKIDTKNNELTAIKIHIPLFGQFLKYEEHFDTMKKQLAKEGIFITTSSQKNNDGAIYQISCNDYELLTSWAKWYEPVEKFEKITKRKFTQEMKTKLIEFINTNSEIPQEGKADVLKQIQEWTIKLLTK